MTAGRYLFMLCVVVVFGLFLVLGQCVAGDFPEQGRPILDKLLSAIETKDYQGFVADGDDGFKAGLTMQMFEGVSNLFSPRLVKGYDKFYLGELRQQDCNVILWKIIFKDGEDDTLAKIALKDGKIAGFWLQ